jgi:hypothetical protein
VQALARQPGKIRQVFAATQRCKAAGGPGLGGAEGITHFRAHFKGLRADARTQPDQGFRRFFFSSKL